MSFQKGFYVDIAQKSTVYDHQPKTCKHLNFFEHECYLHCNLPRVVNIVGKVSQVEVPWAKANSGFILMFEAYSMLLIELEMSVNKVGKLVGEYPNLICIDLSPCN